MITKIASEYMLKEADLTWDDFKNGAKMTWDDIANYISNKVDAVNKFRASKGLTAGNILSKIPVGSEENRKMLRETGLRNFVGVHGAKRMKELNDLKNSLLAKARNAKGAVGDWIAGDASKNKIRADVNETTMHNMNDTIKSLKGQLASAGAATRDSVDSMAKAMYSKLPPALQEALAYGN